MATATQRLYYDGIKAIPLEQLPPEAWLPLSENGQADTATSKHYAAVAFLYRAVEVRANSLSALPFTLTRGETEVWSSNQDDPPKEMPWLDDISELLWQTEAALCLGAQAFWIKEKNQTRRLFLRWLSPQTMTPVWDKTKGLTGYKRRIGPVTKDLELDDVVYFWLRGEQETVPRVAPAQAAMAAAGVIFNADQFIASFFKRGAIKATLLSVPRETSDDERKRVKAWWSRVAEGIGNAWSGHVVASGSVEAVTIGEGLESLSNATLTEEKRQDILSALGVPHSLVMANAANYATSQQDALNFYNLTVMPNATIVERQLNRQLFTPLGLRWKFQPEQLAIFQEDEEQRAASLQALTSSGVPLSLAMEMLGFELPTGWNYRDLDQPEPEPVTIDVLPVPQQAQARLPDMQERASEVRRFKKWAGKRSNPDPVGFKSDLLTHDDKADILADAEDGAAIDAPFLERLDWSNYP